MEGLKKIGWFFAYWFAVLVGLVVVLSAARFALYQTFSEAVHFTQEIVLLMVVGAGLVAREYYKKYVDPPQPGN